MTMGEIIIGETIFKVFIVSWLIFMLLAMGALFIFGGMAIYDSPTIEDVGTREIPCVDDDGNEFVDELCEEEITCSKRGWASEHKCSSEYIKKIKLDAYRDNGE